MLFFNLNSSDEKTRLGELVFLSRSFLAHSLFRIVFVSVAVSGAIIYIHAPFKARTAAGVKNLPSAVSLTPGRIPNSSVPSYGETNDVGKILDTYPEYLEFVLTVGRKVNPKVASTLEKTYQQLEKRDRKKAAHFLFGLRMEIVHYLQIQGRSPRTVSTSDAKMRKWVAKYLYDWYREADEYLLRAVTKAS